MSQSSHPGPAGIWRVLILDPDPADPMVILAVVARPSDVRPARPGSIVDELTRRWAAAAAGLDRPPFTPVPNALVWRVDEGGQQ